MRHEWVVRPAAPGWPAQLLFVSDARGKAAKAITNASPEESADEILRLASQALEAALLKSILEVEGMVEPTADGLRKLIARSRDF